MKGNDANESWEKMFEQTINEKLDELKSVKLPTFKSNPTIEQKKEIQDTFQQIYKLLSDLEEWKTIKQEYQKIDKQLKAAKMETTSQKGGGGGGAGTSMVFDTMGFWWVPIEQDPQTIAGLTEKINECLRRKQQQQGGGGGGTSIEQGVIDNLLNIVTVARQVINELSEELQNVFLSSRTHPENNVSNSSCFFYGEPDSVETLNGTEKGTEENRMILRANGQQVPATQSGTVGAAKTDRGLRRSKRSATNLLKLNTNNRKFHAKYSPYSKIKIQDVTYDLTETEMLFYKELVRGGQTSQEIKKIFHLIKREGYEVWDSMSSGYRQARMKANDRREKDSTHKNKKNRIEVVFHGTNPNYIKGLHNKVDFRWLLRSLHGKGLYATANFKTAERFGKQACRDGERPAYFITSRIQSTENGRDIAISRYSSQYTTIPTKIVNGAGETLTARQAARLPIHRHYRGSGAVYTVYQNENIAKRDFSGAYVLLPQEHNLSQ